MNLVERINKDKRLKLLLFLILLVTVVLFMKIFYEYYVYSKDRKLEETKVVLNDDESVEVIKYSEVLNSISTLPIKNVILINKIK